MIETRKLSVGYDKKIVLSDVSFAIHPGMTVTLIGPNGSGKSTLLKTIANQLSAIDGDILIDESLLSNMGKKDISTKLGLLLTERIRPELMTCFDVVCTGRYPYTGRLGILSDTDKEIAYKAMEQVHVHELADEMFEQISDGQRQRVMLARAICQDTDYLIMDEPTTYLDINYKLEFAQIIDELKKSGKGIVMSIHELELARKLSDLIVCINSKGEVDRIDTSENIFNDNYIDSLFGMKPGSYLEYLKFNS